MREWQFNGNLALAESRESYCLFSQRTLLSNIFTTNKVAQASLTCREGGGVRPLIPNMCAMSAYVQIAF